MALTKHTPKNVPQFKKGQAIIRIHRLSCISITKTSADRMGLAPGSKISFVQDDNDKEWYIVKDEDGFELRDQKKAGSLVFNCTYLANLILNSCGLPDVSYKINISAAPTELEGKQNGWALITSSARK